MAKIFKTSNVSVNPDNILAEEIYTGVIVQGECNKDSEETDENHLNFRNRDAAVSELIETKITGKITIHHSGESDLTASFDPESILLVTDFKTITEKKAKDIVIGDNLVDSNFYQNFLEKNEEVISTHSSAVFVQGVDYDTTTEFDGYNIVLDSSIYSWHGIFVDDMFVKYETN